MLLDFAKYALLALAVSLVAAPHASSTDACVTVDHHDATCLRAGSTSYGSCDDHGSEWTGIHVSRYSYADGAASHAGVGASCSAYSYEGEEVFYRASDRSVHAGVEIVPGVGGHLVWHASEHESTWGAGAECAIRASAAGVTATGPCFAGPPPRLPLLA